MERLAAQYRSDARGVCLISAKFQIALVHQCPLGTADVTRA